MIVRLLELKAGIDNNIILLFTIYVVDKDMD